MSKNIFSLNKTKVSLVMASAMMILSACGNKEKPYVERPVEQLYNQAKRKLDEGRYLQAAEEFEEVERQHPYSQWAVKAKLMTAYSYYEEMKYDDAIIALDNFLQLHPGHPDADYAYYLRGVCYYEQIVDIRRDQSITEKALDSFQQLVDRYPDSKYSKDAQLKLSLTRNHLAGKEMAIGRYYLKNQMYNAAINRFQKVIINYQTTSQTPEALHRLTEAYIFLGLNEEAQASAAVLGYNYPESEWYQDSYRLLASKDLEPVENKSSWISRSWKSLFKK